MSRNKYSCATVKHGVGRTLEDLGAQEVLVVVQELVGGSKLLDGVLGGGAHNDSDAVHGVTVVLIPAHPALLRVSDRQDIGFVCPSTGLHAAKSYLHRQYC